MSLLTKAASGCVIVAAVIISKPAAAQEVAGPSAPASEPGSVSFEAVVEEPPAERERVARVFGVSLLSQSILVGSIHGLVRAGDAGVWIAMPMAIAWPSVTALVAWVVGDRSEHYRARYGPLFGASYLSWIPAMIATGAAVGIAMQACTNDAPFGELGCAIRGMQIGGSISYTLIPAGFEALAYVMSREPREEHPWHAR